MAQLKSWIQKKWNNWFNPPIELGTYFTINSEFEDKYPIVINIHKGPFEGVIFAFKDFHVEEDGKMTYEPLGIQTPIKLNGPTTFTSDDRFSIIANQIMMVLLDAAIKNYKEVRKEILSNEEDRTDYIEEPVTQRTVRKKSNTVSKKRVHSRQKRKTRFPGNSGLHSKVQPPANNGSDSDIPRE